MAGFGIPGQNINTLAYADFRRPTIPLVGGPRRPTTTDKKFAIGTEWRTDKNSTAPVEEGEFWKLVRFESNGNATWVRFAGGNAGAIVSLTGDDGTAVEPDISGDIDILGSTVANATNAKPLYIDGDATSNNLTLELQVSAAITGAPGDKNDAGVCSFNDTHFTVDTDGYVSLAGGGLAIDSITGDDSVAISPDAAGNLNFTGEVVANATNAKPVYFVDSGVANTEALQVQVACDRTGKPSDKLDAGICSFSDDQFLVDANGYVNLAGGVTAPILTITDDNGDPTGPSGGDVIFKGTTVANGTNSKPVFIDGTPASYTVETMVQVAAAITGAPGDKNDAGICSFNDTHFTVDTDGYVSLVGGGLAIDAFSTDVAGPVAPDGTGTVDVTGTSVFSDGTTANTLTLNVQATANTFLIGAGANTTATELGPLTDGQVIIGATAGAPAGGTLTEGSGISITNAANSITISSTGSTPVPGVQNIGITYSGGTFTVTSANGTALSASNPGYVTMQSNANPGQLVTVTVTADQTFVDDSGTSTIAGNLFGFQSADTITGYDVPFFLYAVVNDSDDAISFMISRQQSRRISPVNTEIGVSGSADGDEFYSFFALGSPTVTDYDENPCLMIGSFRMRLTTAGGDWTVQTLNANDGIGNYQEEQIFFLPVAIFGAAASTHFRALGGTAPILDDVQYKYKMLSDGNIFISYTSTTGVSTAGVGAVQAQLICPFAPGTSTRINRSALLGEYNEGAQDKTFLNGSAYSDYIVIIYCDANNTLAENLDNADIPVTIGEFHLTGIINPLVG